MYAAGYLIAEHGQCEGVALEAFNLNFFYLLIIIMTMFLFFFLGAAVAVRYANKAAATAADRNGN